VTPLPGATSHAGFDAVNLDTVVEMLGVSTRALAGAGIPYVLMGGLASTVHGRPRCSSDVDLFVKPEHAMPALAVLAREGFTTEETNPHWLFKATREGVLVDLLFKATGDIYLDDEMLARATMRPYRGQVVRVMPPEDLIVIKALVHDEETPRHWYDALGILAAADLDWEYLVRRARKGPARVASLLCYATSVGLVVPRAPVRRLIDVLLEARFEGVPS
jgi:predicted nucleotidyltransferase